MIEVKLNEKAAAAAQNAMRTAPKQTVKAAIGAINRTVTKTAALISKETRVRYIVKAADVKKSLKKKKATSASMTASVISTGAPLPLVSFKVTHPRRGPMKAKVLKRGALKSVQGLYQNEKARYKGVLLRKTGARYPVKSPFGPSIPTMIGNEEVLGRLTPQISAFLNQRFMHELDYQLGRLYK